jgi:hypothetical protein
MRRILDSHSRVAIATENHFLGHLLPWEGARVYFRRVGDLHDDAAVRRLVDLVYSPEFQRRSRFRELSPYWRWLTRRVRRDRVEAALLASDRSEHGVFEAFLRLYAEATGKSVIGEKTPAHLAYVETLLDWFPGAQVVHMVRDPRAVYASEIRRRRERAVTVPYRWLVRVPALMDAFVLLQVTWAWAVAVGRHRVLRRRYPGHYRAVRFEDLVRQPEATLVDLCASLGVGFEPRMLEQRVTSKGARVGETGFDAGAADRWREVISTPARRAIDGLLGARLREMGYR